MTDKDIARIAAGFATTEAILEDSPGDEAGHGMSAVRIAQDCVAGEIARDRPRFSRARFDMQCFPRQHERLKQALIRAAGGEPGRYDETDDRRFHPEAYGGSAQ